MMTIGPNKYQFFGRIIVLTTVLFFVMLFVIHKTKINLGNAPMGSLIFLIVILVFTIFMLIMMLLQLIILPKAVEIDDENHNLVLKFLFATPMVLFSKELQQFSTIKVSTKSSIYEGLLITTKNGKQYIVGDFNLNDYQPIRVFLENEKIEFVGHYKFSFIRYFIKYFRSKIGGQ